ncbi:MULTISPECIES: hypothetical protein [Clostridium]|uniref:Uncharacterized protein n=1 Tax=Clostridium celatum DSM 1785 TaxID=545697 RepID=L1QM45_9CLOT|nr:MULTISPECIES: hypothetical protein [Clostridium]EKY28642.1 hypothetical protein HMPREF0216_00695 [Clostridium celatum DSM 1785]MBX9137114.1 hypothetical protein [Clostridium sp. K12(2020)]MBX9143797.1 hypothetical protein [Clostridium sp. K13]MDU2288663.1 hypothetical protein [Clostridium celatum]MDU4882578.1 hypothetical protein [Clostridium celatum]
MANQYPKVNLFIENTDNYDEDILSKFLTLSVANQIITTLPNDKELLNYFIEEVKKEL